MRKDMEEIRKGLLGIARCDEERRRILAAHVAAFPGKDDYGLGRDGYTLDDPEEIKIFYENLGIKTWAQKKPRVRVKHYKSSVGSIVDDMIRCLDGEDSYLGMSCCRVRVSDLIRMGKGAWLDEMCGNFHRVSPLMPTKSQVKAWGRNFSELKLSLRDHVEYHALTAIFEYVITAPKRRSSKANPKSKGKRPDLVVLSKTAVAVIEFKGYELAVAAAKGEVRECRNYAARISKAHSASQGMRVGAILVLEAEERLMERREDVWCCSPDMIAEAMAKVLGRHPKPHPDVDGWIEVAFK